MVAAETTDAKRSSALRNIPGLDRSLPSGERVYQGLRYSILRGQLLPNTRLVELTLAADFGVSRTPVREALKRLSAEGLVTADSSRGMVVRGLTFREVEEIYEVREVLEGLATRLAARRLSAEELAKLRVLLDLMHEHIEGGQLEALVQANVKFHDIIAQAARNDWLMLTMRSITDFVRRFSHTSYSNLDRNREVLAEHSAIIEALEQGDGAGAERLAREHVVRARSFLARLSLEREGAF